MRLSRTARLILGIGIFAVAFAGLYILYSQQSGEQELVKESLVRAQVVLPNLVGERKDLQDKLTRWESELAAATLSLDKSQAKFPVSVESIEYSEKLFKIADGSKLQVMSLTASEPRDTKAGDITYAVTTFGVVVRGEVKDILGMVNAIVTSKDFTSATVEEVNISIPVRELPTETSATIRLVIYDYKGK